MTSRDDIIIEITPQVLLKAYTCGIFPMAESAEDQALYWIEPQQRGILMLDQVHVPRRLAKTIHQGGFEIRIDSDFEGVIDGCAASRPGRRTTWINPKIRALVVGEGPERSALESLARDLRNDGAVLFEGQRARPEPFYRLLAAFALTSRSEGMPVSLLEAWAAGRPVVCTAVGGIPDMIDDSRTGFSVPPDDPAAVAVALGRVLGAKGAGEAGTAGAPAAIMNAINDALRPFGAKVFAQPFTPERILAALGRVPKR